MHSASRAQLFYRVVLVMAAVGLVGAASGFYFPNPRGGMRFSLALLFPFLWILWMVCAYTQARSRHSLILLWALVDCGILTMMAAAWNSNPYLSQSQGTDVIVFVLFCPVVIPLGLLFYWIDEWSSAVLSHLQFGTLDFKLGIGQAFSIWLSFSLIAAVQSYLVTVAFRWFHSWRGKKQRPL